MPPSTGTSSDSGTRSSNGCGSRSTDLDLGITLEPSDVETKTPVDVRGAFEDVNRAEQARSTEISNARSYRDQVVNTALGQSNAVVNAGLVSSNRLVATVAATAQVFQDQLPSYRAEPHLFKERLLAARMERVLTNVNDKFALPEGFKELRLQFSREPEKARPRPHHESVFCHCHDGSHAAAAPLDSAGTARFVA